MARILPLSGEDADAAIEQAALAIRSGSVVAFPTETVYGLGADALNAESVQKIYTAKGRPPTNPLIVHVLDRDAAKALSSRWPDFADALLGAFAPGPLSIVVPKASSVPDIVTAGMNSVAIRIPSHPVARALLEASGVPIAAPSANRANAVSPTTAQHVQKSLGGRIDLILDGGAAQAGLESTVVDLTVTPPRILRPGPVARSQIEAVIGSVDAPEEFDDSDLINSPGMLRKHYSPDAVLHIVSAADFPSALAARSSENIGCIVHSSHCEPPDYAEVIRLPADARQYGAQLYAALHAMDERGVAEILLEEPPHGDEWHAVHDRLRRAAHQM